MSAFIAIVTIGSIPIGDIVSQLVPELERDEVTHLSLLGRQSRSQIMAQYAPELHEARIYTRLADGEVVALSHTKVERDLQGIIEVLESRGVKVIWLMTTAKFNRLSVNTALLLDPQRLVPPLVAAIADGHQVGILLSYSELCEIQADKWQALATPPVYAVWNAFDKNETDLLAAGRQLLAHGAEVVVMDCPDYHPAHRGVLEKHLDAPILLSNEFIAEMAQALLP